MTTSDSQYNLSDIEQRIVLAAWSGAGRGRGLIIIGATIGDSFMIAGGEQFNFHDDNRLAAEYKEAVENLRHYGLVQYSQNEGYWLTAAGYRLGDLFSNQTD